MPSFDFIKKSEIKTSFRVESIKGRFDLKEEHAQEHFSGIIPIEGERWQIGVIYGGSGTGKTSIAKTLFPTAYFTPKFAGGISVIDEMPKSATVEAIAQQFNSVGFSSPPSWLKPYDVLSMGEKMRAELAYAMLCDAETICFDEFTSVVDRTVAKIGSAAIAKNIRRQNNKRFIAVSCHSDILDWLEPDWTFCTDSMRFEKKNGKDRQSNYLSGNAKRHFGRYLENIII